MYYLYLSILAASLVFSEINQGTSNLIDQSLTTNIFTGIKNASSLNSAVSTTLNSVLSNNSTKMMSTSVASLSSTTTTASKPKLSNNFSTDETQSSNLSPPEPSSNGANMILNPNARISNIMNSMNNSDSINLGLDGAPSSSSFISSLSSPTSISTNPSMSPRPTLTEPSSAPNSPRPASSQSYYARNLASNANTTTKLSLFFMSLLLTFSFL